MLNFPLGGGEEKQNDIRPSVYQSVRHLIHILSAIINIFNVSIFYQASREDDRIFLKLAWNMITYMIIVDKSLSSKKLHSKPIGINTNTHSTILTVHTRAPRNSKATRPHQMNGLTKRTDLKV